MTTTADPLLAAGYRARSLAETAELAIACLERCGISRIADVTELDVLGIPVFHSVRPEAAAGLNTVTSGKGVTAAAAWVSAALEAIERTFCEVRGRTVLRTSYEEADGRGLALDPRRLVPRRGHGWRPDSVIGWWPMREVLRDVEVLVPALAVFTPYPYECEMFRSNTIGLASGNTHDEALLHALYELVEHDCTAFAEKLRLGFRITEASLPGQARALIERFSRAGIEVSVFACDSGLGMYSFYVTAEDTHAQDAMLINGGAGCSLDPTVALYRALTETAQSRLAVIGGAREDLDTQAYRRHASYDSMKDILHAWSAERPTRSFDDIPDLSTGSVDGDLTTVLDRLRGGGLDVVLSTELSPPDLPFSVVKAVVPGIEFTHVDHRRVGTRITRALAKIRARETSGGDL
ncbi:YcaO-like family protein [Streptomyces mauvecolor]